MKGVFTKPVAHFFIFLVNPDVLVRVIGNEWVLSHD